MAAVSKDPPRSRLSIALGAALALHAIGALFGHRLAHDTSAAAAASEGPPATEETEIDLFDALAEVRGEEAFDPGDALRLAALTASSLARARERQAGLIAGAPSEASNAPGSQEIGSTEGSYALDPSADAIQGASQGPPIQLGIGSGDWSRWVDPTATPNVDSSKRAERRPAPISSTGGLAEALEAHDQSVGIGPAGAVLTAVHQVGYSDVAPAIGTATFAITVLRSGAVEVQLTGASSQAAEWAKVGDSIAAAIRKKPPRIPSTRIGVRLGIEVVAEERWPNGQRAQGEGPKLALTPPSFKPTETAKEELLTRNPAAVPPPDTPSGKPPLQANFAAPGLTVKGRGKVCSYEIGISPIPISGGCDPANIGAPPRRVVSTRVISQTML